MNFETARRRVVAHLRGLVRNGQITERGLARLTGISQSHVHNVLKGVRDLTPEIGDVILHELKLDLLDLVEPEDLAGRLGDEAFWERIKMAKIPEK